MTTIRPFGFFWRAALAFVFIGDLFSLNADPSEPPPTIRDLIERFDADAGNVGRYYEYAYSKEDLDAHLSLYRRGLEKLNRLDFQELDAAGRVDYLLFREQLNFEQAQTLDEKNKLEQASEFFPFAEKILPLFKDRREVNEANARKQSEILTEVRKEVSALVERIEDKMEDKESVPYDKTMVNRAARILDRLVRDLDEWNDFYSGYDPEHSWWCRKPYEDLKSELEDYAGFLRESIVGYERGEDAPIIGDPIGRDSLLKALKREWIAYTPEELIEIAEREFEWCQEQRVLAAKELGFGEDWRKAQEHVKEQFVPPGKQPKLIKDLALEAIDFLEQRDLLTIPPLCKDTWRMRMMSPERQKVNPYFTGGEVISVSYPTDEMTHEEKLMSLRGNNVHFSRATVHHELIPGHHLQLFMAERYRPYRELFRTPFLVEGWALYWEMQLWDLDFPRSPEDRLGMLFWRSHRCARIIFSLSFHLGRMTAQEAIEFLIDRVGHERRNATAEVRRSVQGGYSPLYQAAYMLGGLQIRAMYWELVESGQMSAKTFHDAILRENAIPVELIRASLRNEALPRDYQAQWRFHEDLDGGQGLRAELEDSGRKPPERPVDLPVYKERIEAHWFDDDRQFWYRNDLADERKEFVLVDAERGVRRPAFDHRQAAVLLSKLVNETVDPRRLPVETLEFDLDTGGILLKGSDKSWRFNPRDSAMTETSESAPASRSLEPLERMRRSSNSDTDTEVTFVNEWDEAVDVFWADPSDNLRRYFTLKAGETRAQHTYSGHVWVIKNKDDESLCAFQASRAKAAAVIDEAVGSMRLRERRRSSRQEPDVARSPDDRLEAFVRDHNLWIRVRETGEEFALSTDGSADDSYQKDGYRDRSMGLRYERPEPPGTLPDVYWSPDSSRLAAMKTPAVEERNVYLVDSSPSDQLQPKLDSYPYLKPGDDIPAALPHLFDVEKRKEIPIESRWHPRPWSIQRLEWAEDGGAFTFVYNQRGHQVMRWIRIDARTGEAKAVINEEPPTFFDYANKFYLNVLNETGEAIWMSERDGWNHLYLYDAESGLVKNQITQGRWVVRGVDRVDEERRRIWFRAGGIYPGQDPYYVHYCRINFDGSDLVLLTEGDGTHELEFSPDREFYIDTWSRVDRPPAHELRHSEDGSLVCELEQAKTESLAKLEIQFPERFAAAGRDGQTPIHGIIHRPWNFDPGKRYPVIESIYAGPHGAHVPKSFRRSYRQQQIADLGFIVVQIDGMGTNHRSKAFHDVCWKNLGDAGFPDRIAWMKAAASRRPFLDLNRVGIYGGSAGGQNALGALLRHGDFYKAAVADCGCHDNRMDKIWWNELWMGWPVGKHYEEQSNVAQAHKLQGDLLLIVGELDKNVDPSSTLQVVDALIKADKDFDMLMMPGAGHGAAGTSYGWKRLKQFFQQSLL